MAFKKLAALGPKPEREIWLDISTWRNADGTCARVRGKCAGEVNKPYWAAVLRMGSTRSQKIARGVKMTPEMLAEYRDEDRVLFPAYVITGWENVHDDEEKPVAFSTEACKECFAEMPFNLLDEIRNHFAMVSNFVDEVTGDPKAFAKNS